MKPWLIPMALTLCTAVLPGAGCLIELGGDDDIVCNAPAAQPSQLRNPFTGQCESFGGGGGGACDPASSGEDTPSYPTEPWPWWGACYSQCEQLDEISCAATAGCVAAYFEICPEDAGCDYDSAEYIACWAAAPIVVPELPCASLEAEACNGRSDCSPVYTNRTGIPSDSPLWQFTGCRVESVPEVCSSDDQCGPGYQCNLEDTCYPPPGCGGDGGACPAVCYGRCVPEASGCDLVDCRPGYHCEVSCQADDGCREGPDGDCAPPPPVCETTCVPDGASPVGECTGITVCPEAEPACPVGTTPGIGNGCWTHYCIPLSECGHDPGTCGGEVACDASPPACPAGTVPGVRGACWSGYCIPRVDCEAPATCEEMTSESACRSRGDCSPVYEGMNCTCRPDGGCDCTDHRYSRCEPSVPVPDAP